MIFGKAMYKEFKVILLRSSLCSVVSEAKFALILSPLTMDPEKIIEMTMKIQPTVPETK